MSIISFSCTKEGVSVVHTTAKKTGFTILFYERVAIVSGNWVALAKSLESILNSRHKTAALSHCVIVKAASGKFSASPDTYKAEGFAEYVINAAGLTAILVNKRSFLSALGCAKGEKWQTKSRVLFDGNKAMKGFHDGYDAACAGAYGVAK